MHNSSDTGQTAREQMVYQYLTALRKGDINTVQELLTLAEQDPLLEQMLWELHAEEDLQTILHTEEPVQDRGRQRVRFLFGETTPSSIPGQDHPHKRRRLSILAQATAAVLAVVIIVGGFLTWLAAYRSALSSSVKQLNWCLTPTPHVNDEELSAIAMLSSTDGWAVGSYFYVGILANGAVSSASDRLTLIEHWDGQTWKIVPSPNLGAGLNVLSALVALSPDNVWAVGTAYATPAKTVNKENTAQTLTEHWDGQAWKIVPSPNLNSQRINSLSAIAAISATDIWAVGRVFSANVDAAVPSDDLIEHWDGSHWSIVSSPSSGGSNGGLSGVVALSGNNVWAGGGFSEILTTEHWDGKSWSVVPMPNSTGTPAGFTALAATSANDVWAMGQAAVLLGVNAGQSALIEHWDGKNWSFTDSPVASNVTNYSLNSVVALAPDDVWAAGGIDEVSPTPGNAGLRSSPLIEHWNGRTWQIVTGPRSTDAGDSFLYSIAATPSHQIWMTGFQNIGANTILIAHSC